MADNWRILDCTYLDGELSFDSSKRKVRVIDCESGEVSEHSPCDINIVFVGIRVRLLPATMYHLAKNDIVVLFCDWKGLPVSGMYPWIDAHGRVAARQRAQASLSVPRQKNAWMRIVKAKICGQANNLRYFDSPDNAKLDALSNHVKSGDPDNKEAQAARIYWPALFPGESFTRRPGTHAGNRNSLLDYAYTILRGHSIRAVLSAGLAPALGICHKGRSNAFALADDLIEPFRPAVDFAVRQLDDSAQVEDRGTRRILLEATLKTFSKDGRGIPAAMTDLSQSYGKYVEGEIEHLNVPVWDPRAI